MNIIQAKVTIPQADDAVVSIPIAVPDLTAVYQLAEQLHEQGRPYEGQAWGWPVQYDPEIREEAAEFQIPDGQGLYRTEIRPFWTPASFTIGQNGFWFYSLLWEDGPLAPPRAFLE